MMVYKLKIGENIMKSTKNIEVKASVRFKGPLAAHIKECTGANGLFDNISDYLKTLVRRDFVCKPSLEDHLSAVWETLLPGAMANESEFEAVTLAEIQTLGRKQAGLKS